MATSPKHPKAKRRARQGSRGRDGSAAAATRLTTRQVLLEAAGEVFAEQGYERSTAKEICRRAGANAAAVNYHFGGIEPLYAAVLAEARRRIFTAQAIARAIEGKDEPAERLEATVGVIVRGLLSPAASSWAARLFGRDLISLSPTSDVTKEKFAVPRARLMRGLASQLMKLPEDDPLLASACLSLMAPICTLILADRRILQRALPALDLSTANSEALARELVRYALAGLAASASQA